MYNLTTETFFLMTIKNCIILKILQHSKCSLVAYKTVIIRLKIYTALLQPFYDARREKEKKRIKNLTVAMIIRFESAFKPEAVGK